MKNFSNSRLFRTILFFLTVAVIAKIIWLVITLLFLPKSGVEHIVVSKAKPLYYRIKLANKSKSPIAKVAPVVTAAPVVKSPVTSSMQGIKLLALYNASDALVVTVRKEKDKKTEVLSKGDNIDGFVLSSAGSDYAIFIKDKKDFKLILDGSKIKKSNTIKIVKSSKTEVKVKPKERPTESIVESEDGMTKVVSKGLLTSYSKDIKKVWTDIGIGEHKINGKLDGFKVNFVKKGSDFEKLGLKRGDVLQAVNGQELNSYSAAYSFYNDMKSIENLTLSIKRNNQDMELEYEIR